MDKTTIPFGFLLILTSLYTGCYGEYISKYTDASDDLVLVHVLHRHGARTRSEETYPNDPYVGETFWPFGYEELTNDGKLGEYQLGMDLRARYDKFLGDVFYPEIVEARSSASSRTQMSISLSLAGLFPPKNVSIWNKDLNWQPIPYTSYSAEEDQILGKPKKYCPKYKKLLKKYKKNDGAEIFKDDLELYEYLSSKTGSDVSDPDDVYDIFKILTVEEEWGLKLPNWTNSVWKDKLKNAAAKRFLVRTGTQDLKILSSGFFLEKIISDTEDKISGKSKHKDRRLFLYSAHEQNIGHILASLGLFDNEIPNYGSHLLFEVRQKNGIHGIEIYYQNYYKGNDQPTLLVLPGCDSFCPVDKFTELLEHILPTKKTTCKT